MADYRTEVLADTPVSYVRFEETAGTAIANEVAGVAAGVWLGAPTLGGSPGPITGETGNRFATLADASQWGHFPVPALSTGMSFEFWTRHAPNGWVFNRAASATHTDPYYNFGVANNGSGFIIFTLNTLGNGWPTDRWSTGIQFVDDGAFHHYVFTYDGANLTLFIDGVQQAQTARSGNILSSTENLAINALKNLGSGGSPSTWDVDEIAVYDHALTSTRVAAHYAARSAAPAPPSAPVNTSPPSVWFQNADTTYDPGVLLGIDGGEWDFGTGFALQWQISNNGTSGWTDIAGQTTFSYTIQAGDAGKYLRGASIVTNSVGTTTAYSAAVHVTGGSAPVDEGPISLVRSWENAHGWNGGGWGGSGGWSSGGW